MLNRALEPICSVTPALQKHLCKVGKQKSHFPGMTKAEPFTHPHTVCSGRGTDTELLQGPCRKDCSWSDHLEM